MKRGMLAIALITGFMVMVAGCGASTVETESELPLATMNETPIPYVLPLNSGIGVIEGMMRVNEAEGYFEKYTGGYFPSAVMYRNEALISPVHEDWKLALLPTMRGYAVWENACYWLEGSYTPERDTDHWALYVQERQEDATPVLLDEGTFTYEEGDAAMEGFSRCFAFVNDGVLWANNDGSDVEVKHFSHSDGITTVLDVFEGDMNEVVVAMDAGHAAWTRPTSDETVYVNLNDPKPQVIAQGCGIGDPLISDEYLIVRTGCDNDEANALWVCDLREEDRQFDYQIDSTQISSHGRAQHLETPLIIDAGHIALSATGSQAVYEMTVVDLATATMAITANTRTKEPLLFCPLDCFENSLRAASKDKIGALDCILPSDSRGKNMVLMLRYMDDMYGNEELTQILYPINFQWSKEIEE